MRIHFQLIWRCDTMKSIYNSILVTPLVILKKKLVEDLSTFPRQAKPGSRMQLYYKAWQCLRKMPHHGRFAFIDKLLKWANLESTPRPSYRPMNAIDLEQISGDGLISIGAHTMTHPSLPGCPVQEKWNEILNSKHVLEELLGEKIDHFAYPHGDYDFESVEMVRKAGFQSACITLHKTCNQIGEEY